MNLNDAKTLIAQEMRNHGLLESGWTWRWDNARKRFGQCQYGPKRLSFSSGLFLLNDEATCHDTVLHEIAHAIAGSAAGHGPAWKAVCRRIGADPTRCKDATSVNLMASKWVGTCGCGREFPRDRLTERMRRGAIDPKCRGPIQWRQNF